MNIAMVTDAYNYGRGGDVATIRLAEGLKKRGHIITVVSTKIGTSRKVFPGKGFCPPSAEESLKNGFSIRYSRKGRAAKSICGC